MNGIQKGAKAALSAIRRNRFVLLAATFYLLSTAYYMGPAFIHCGSFVNGFGDSTSGPIWRYSMDDSSPLLGNENFTGYPSGENLRSPIEFALIGQTMLLWGSSKVVGPVCGYNSVNALGYLATALVMFAFILALTKNRWIALFAGYAVSFTPYFQVKVGAHPGYGFVALLIAALWGFLALLQRPSVKQAIILAIIVGCGIYFDPYYSLLLGTVGIPLGLVFITRLLWQARNKKLRPSQFQQIKTVTISAAIVFAMAIPLLLIMFTQKTQIAASLQGTRDNMVEVAKACSNWPQEYFLPFPESPLWDALGNSEKQLKQSLYAFSNCGIAEDAVGISYTVLGIVGVGLIILGWERLNARRTHLSSVLYYDSRLIMYGVGLIVVAAILIALPPLRIHGIPTPSQVLISATSTWRVVSREYVVVNMALIIMASIVMAYFYKTLGAKKKLLSILFVVAWVMVVLQYQIGPPLAGYKSGGFSYVNIPPAYEWLKQQGTIPAIVEYPMEKITETNTLGYYLTMQTIHKKPLFNSALVNSPQNQYASALKNLNDPQTLPALYQSGIRHVVIHGLDMTEVSKIPYLRVLKVSGHAPGHPFEGLQGAKDTIIIASIETPPRIEYTLRFTSKLPYNSIVQKSPATWEYEVPNTTTFIVSSEGLSTSKHIAKSSTICFSAKSTTKKDADAKLLIKSRESGTVYLDTPITEIFSPFTVNLPLDNELQFESKDGSNVRLKDIGCK